MIKHAKGCICLMLLVNCYILSPELLPHSKTAKVKT